MTATAALYGKKDEIYGFQTLYREIGYYITRLEQYNRALKFFDEALKKTPNDKRALIGRSRARAKACEYEGALNDINKALQLDPDDLVVLAHKALNTYLSCEFEKGLVLNTRLVPIRSKPDNFTMGVMDCSNAIENCIGERVGRPLRDHFKIIRKLAWKRNYEAQKPFQPKTKHKKKKNLKDKKEPVFEGKAKKKKALLNLKLKKPEDKNDFEEECEIRDSLHSHRTEENVIPPFNKPFPYKPSQNYTTNIENYMAEKYLDSMYLDKIFLKKLRLKSGINCPNVAGSKQLRKLACDGFKTVNYKQELLRTRKPFYSIKNQEATAAGGLKLRQEAALNLQRESAKRDADVLLNKIEIALLEKQLKVLLDIAEQLRLYCETTHINILPDRGYYLQQIYKNVCQAHYDVYRLNKKQMPSMQNKRIYVVFGLAISREPSTDSVISQFQGVYLDYKKQIALYENRLRNAMDHAEMALLFHELSRYHCEIKHYELSRVYAKKCITEGRHCDNFKWVVNGLMLLAKISVLQHNKNDAKNQLTRTMQVAKEQKDAKLEEYLNRCLKVIETVEFDDGLGFKVLEKREKQIVKLMANSKMKDEASHLFRLMSAMPSARRMVVIPGVRIEDVQESKSQGAIQRSIMPEKKSSGDESESASQSARSKKFENRKQIPKGLAFMELIQYHVD